MSLGTRVAALVLAITTALVPRATLDAQQHPDRAATPSVPSTEYLRSVVRFLSQNELQGREAGTPGGRLAELYLSSQFEALGLEGGGAGATYLRELALVAVTSDVTVVLGGQAKTVTLATDDPGFVAWPTRAEATVTSDGELVFVGFGIRAPEYGWDDFGDAPLTGRILVVLPGDPGFTDTTLFRGLRGTHYGTVEQKVREAASRGARGVIVVHDAALSGMPWNATRASVGQEVLLDPDESSGGAPDFLAWISDVRLAELIGAFGRDFTVLRARAQLAAFTPIPLGAHAVVQMRNTVRPARTASVLGWVRGRDAALAEEAVVVTAHYDHLGVVPGFGSDSVFNGARDNAAGVAVLLGAAEALRAMPQAPRRSVLFVAVTAAEGAQRDPASLTKQVPVAPEHITAVVNIERPDLSHDPPMISDVDGADAGLIGALEAAAHQEGVQAAPWRGLNPGKQTLVHVAFARLGVPGLTILGGSGRSGPDSLYYATRYHQSSDEFDPDARLDGLRAQARTVARLTRLIADADDAAAWSPDSPYRAAWERLERRRMRRPGR